MNIKSLPVYFVTLSISIIALLGIFVFFLPYGHPQLHLQDNTDKNSIYSKATHCILYDRPPRTASSTISKALVQCMRQKQYKRAPSFSENRSRRPSVIRAMLSLASTTKASITAHITISSNDINNIQNTCEKFLYISSCAPMHKRIISQIKYGLNANEHGNSTIVIKELLKAVQRRSDEKIEEQEQFLEMYPFSDNEKEKYKTFQPDYVIRQSNLIHDLRILLDALGCEHVSVENENVHEVEVAGIGKRTERQIAVENEIKMVMRERIESLMTMDDRRFENMLKIVYEQNDIGLLKAKLF